MTLPHALLSLALGALCAAGSSAQSQPYPIVRSEPRDLFGPSRGAEFVHNVNGPVDLNGDGIDDYVSGAWFGLGGSAWRSTGGRFEDLTAGFGSLRIVDLIVDWNRDGRWDLTALSVTNEPVFLLDDGTGGYTEVPCSVPAPLGPFVELIGAVDLDGFPGPELLVETQDSLLVWTAFPGAPGLPTPSSFQLVELSRTTRPVPVFFGPQAFLRPIDFDRDGDPDLIDGTGQVYENLGGGVLAVGPQVGFFNSILNGTSQSTVVADVNGDGVEDYVNTAIHLGRPSGGFVTILRPLRPDGYAVAAKDLDGDGLVDLVWVRRSGSIEILINQGSNRFGLNQTFDPGGSGFLQLNEVGDFDGDGDLDLLLQGQSRYQLMLNDGQASFEPTSSGIFPADQTVVAYGDFNGDGWVDGVSVRGVLLRGVPGEGRFEAALLGGVTGFLRFAVPGDIDGDGDLDVVGERILVNDGSGRLVDQTASRLLDSVHGPVELADLDGDGDLDRIAYKDGFTRLFRNNGNGVFLLDLVAFPLVARDTPDGAILDIEGDGDLDLVVCDSDPSATDGGVLWVQDSNGNFSEQSLPRTAATFGPWNGADAGDIDGDGDDDVVVASLNGIVVLENQNGVLVSSLPNGSGNAPIRGGVTLKDVDGDGALDIVSDRIHLNDGFGRFTESTVSLIDIGSIFDQPGVVLVPPQPGTAPAVVDIDEDGDLDLIWPEPSQTTPLEAGQPRVGVNLARQLTLEGVSCRGSFLNLRVDEVLGRTAGPRTVTMLIAGGSGRQTISGVGVLRLDNSTLSVAGSMTVPTLETAARFALPIPDAAALQGLEIWSQALITEPLGRLRLTGAVRETIR